MMKELHLLQEEAAPNKFWENPLISFSLIRHMQSDWHMWQIYMEKPVGLENLAYMENIKRRLPQSHDFYDAAEGLKRIQLTYNLSALDISQGLLDGVQYNSSLTALDCFAAAEHLINRTRWSFAQQWLQAASIALERPEPQPAMVVLRGITPALVYRTAALTDELEEKASMAYQIALSYSPQDAELWQQFFNFELRSLTLPGSHSIKPEEKDPYENLKLPYCCTGRCKLPLKLQLYCLWNTETHPFLRLAPIKTEILSIDPQVVLFHDIVSEAERTFLQSFSKKELEPSLVLDVAEDTREPGQFRTSKSAWLDSNITKTTERLTVLLEDATGLDMKYSEPFQVINYGIGGLFETHLDSFLPNEAIIAN
ncbi:hypothetical protein KR032_006570 [Drosophila birchii]|nr:hypothetical protein KR032_006570 [Drosophila birchii]